MCDFTHIGIYLTKPVLSEPKLILPGRIVPCLTAHPTRLGLIPPDLIMPIRA